MKSHKMEDNRKKYEIFIYNDAMDVNVNGKDSSIKKKNKEKYSDQAIQFIQWIRFCFSRYKYAKIYDRHGSKGKRRRKKTSTITVTNNRIHSHTYIYNRHA